MTTARKYRFPLVLAFVSVAGIVLCAMPLVWSDSQETEQATPQPAIPEVSLVENPRNVLGVRGGDCKKCHPAEVAAWMRSSHFRSADTRLLLFKDNTAKYAAALDVKAEDLMGNSICADCHGTKSAGQDGLVNVVSGVSCESCHGAGGGDHGWLNRHQSYHESMPIPRSQETAAHRATRLEKCDQAGMVRSTNIYRMARQCFECHLIGNETLVANGHKLASTFDFVAWSEGEVRHNFFMDRTRNADAPSLWSSTTGSNAANRRRVKFVIGSLVQLEVALRRRAVSKNPAVMPQLGGLAAAVSGKLAQINAVAGTDETREVGALVTGMLGLLFVPQPTDEKTYTDAAEKVAKAARQFEAKHDGSKLAGLDALIQVTPPFYSQQYREKYRLD
ncbi:MAG: cytochrome c family protein [Planctomycetota bacterium]|nr:cytochrome c family protein [Planctomycetota bacterium]